MKLVIFDFDGTLADTETLITQTMMKTIEAMHLEPRSREEIRAMIGLPLKETFTRLIHARPNPVFPLVGSMMTLPGFRMPFCSASSIMLRAMRSFTLPPGLKNSTLATTCACAFFLAARRCRSTRGVRPTSSVSFS